MLSYNDALAHSQPASTECVVCKALCDPEMVIWHQVKLDKLTWAETQVEVVVPICLDCADLFHDVKPTLGGLLS